MEINTKIVQMQSILGIAYLVVEHESVVAPVEVELVVEAGFVDYCDVDGWVVRGLAKQVLHPPPSLPLRC